MRKTIVVAVREYMAAVKTKAFIISVVAAPILWSGMIAAPMLLEDRLDEPERKVAVLDLTDKLYDAIEEAAAKRNKEEIWEGEGPKARQVRPKFIIEPVKVPETYGDENDLAMSERVRSGELLAFVVIRGESLDGIEVRYHSNSPTYDDFRRWISSVINDRVRQLRFEASQLDREAVERATRYVPVQNLGLVNRTEGGDIKKAEKTNEKANILVPMGMMMLMFMMIMIGASPLVQSVLEEKMNRVAEVLLASVPPFQLMFGKLLGMVGVSVTLSTIYLVGAYVGVQKAGFEQFFPTHVIWWFVLFQILAVLMFGSVFAAIGAAVTDLKEAQSVLTPTMMIAVLPMVFWVPVVKAPSSAMSVILSLIPPMTPAMMVLRITVPPGVPLWQPLLGAVLVLATTVFCVFAAGRVFRVGILMQGKGAKVTEMLRWVLRG